MSYKKEEVVELLGQPRTSENVNNLVIMNEGLVYAQLKKFGMYNDEEAISQALEALYKAIMTFDASKGFAFSTYATVCIYNKLGCYLRSIKSKPEIVSLNAPINEEGETLTDRIEGATSIESTYLEYVSIINIHRIMIVEINKVNNPLHSKILNKWMDTNFTATQTDLAIWLNCSQSYVSKVLAKFRKHVKNKLLEDRI